MIIFNNTSLDAITPIGKELTRMGFSCGATYVSSHIYLPLDRIHGELLGKALSTWINRVETDENKIVPEHGDHSIGGSKSLRESVVDDLEQFNIEHIELDLYNDLYHSNIWQLDVYQDYGINIDEETDPIIARYCDESGIAYHRVNIISYWLDKCTYDGIAEALLEYTYAADSEGERLKAIDLLILLNKSLSLYRSDYNYESLSLIMAQLYDGNISAEKFISLALPFIEGLDVNKWGPRSIEHMRRAASSITESTKKKALKDIEFIYCYLEE